MTLDRSMQDLKFDNRMVEKNLRDGKVSKEEVESHLSGLEDCSANAVAVTLEDNGTSDFDSGCEEPETQAQPVADSSLTDYMNNQNGNGSNFN